MKKKTYRVEFWEPVAAEWLHSGDCPAFYESIKAALTAIHDVRASGHNRTIYYRIVEARTGKVVWKEAEAPAPTTPPVAARTSPVRPYHLVPAALFEMVADRCEVGAQRYGPDQWRAGLTDPAWLCNRADHAVAHLLNYIHGIDNGEDGPEDNLAAVGWAVAVLLEAERAGRTPFREAYEQNKKEAA